MKSFGNIMYLVLCKYREKKFKLFIYLRNSEYIHKLYKYIWRERRVSYGNEHPNETFYIIRRESSIEGICSVLNSVIGHLAYAESKGYIPIVDMKHYFNNMWQPLTRRKKENAWEYYFLQPAGYSLSDIEKSKNIILSDGINAYRVPNLQGLLNNKEVEYWNKIYSKYIRLKPEINNTILNAQIKYFQGRILGVCQRVAILDEKAKGEMLFQGYANSVSIKHMIKETEKRMEMNHCSKMFLVIDNNNVAKMFKEYFGDKVFFYKRERRVPLKEKIRNKEWNEMEGERIKNNIYYIREIMLLAQCSCLVCDQSTGAMTANIVNGNKYEDRIVVRG